jgi:predicted helicase
MSFITILNKHRKISFSERDKGDRFERLMQSYLYTDPKYAHLKKVWLWNEFPFRSDFGSHDIGIDLVAQTSEGEYWAVQCKAYREDARITKQEVDTFLSTSGRSFKDEEGQQVHFAQRLWISTTNNWSSKANETLQNQHPAVTRINLVDLEEAPVEWEKIDEGIFGEPARKAKKNPRYHQKVAIERTIDYFAGGSERGKLIMACGTGKTFTSLRIAEEQAGDNGVVLFLVPSIALLGQTLREWTADTRFNINPIAICSDSEITREKKKNEDAETFSVVDLAIPASTDVKKILDQFELFERTNKQGMTVVFSTYQSIDVISKTQQELARKNSKYAQFDLIVCDEAHRTTGVTLAEADESAFVKVHDNEFLRAEKRLYMTATPRLYGDDSKRKAQEASATIASMDDEKIYGKEIYRIGFGMAVEQGLLSDYKVMILTLSESDVTPEVQKALANTEQEIVNMDDVSKLIGTINAMSKQIISETGSVTINDPEPMRRAVAFVPNIKTSRKITNTFNEIADTYHDSVPKAKQESLVKLRSQHIDGSMSATDRDQLMSWLKADPEDSHESRVLTNVRCLSEGVDVPSLDAVMFLSARNSQVDVVQSVGRVMRKSPGKEYGYIIIPIVIPNDVKPEDALNDNERFKVVWTVLNALRAHDDRFNAIVNQIDLNKNKPTQILIGGPDRGGTGNTFGPGGEEKPTQTGFNFGELQTAIYAKMVNKVGERAYWENWAKDIADIADRHIKRITKIVDEDDEAHMAFRQFVRGLQKNLNPSISEADAIQMLSQHIITKPVFEALFEKYSFANSNPVSQAMQKALDAIEHKAVSEEELEIMEGFYRSVRRRAEGVDNAEGKQRIIVELYDKFFKTGFPKLVEQWGIVYTPVEVVDFIIHSVSDVLQKEFGRSLSDEGVNIIDPFTGTGTFITRLLQSGLIKKEDLERKYKNEIFANEFLLLAYYIGAVNIENVYHDIMGKDEYDEFPGIVLTDTFQLYEDDDNEKLFSDALAENSERLQRQKQKPLRVIMGNPPYSAKQKSANDNAQNIRYPRLDSRIADTYAKESTVANKNSLYDSYVKAFRWASDRLEDEAGVVGYITNSGWLESNGFDGFRKHLSRDFSDIFILDLQGAIRGQAGDQLKKEGQNIFNILTGVAIVILVKNPKKSDSKIHYAKIGDYLDKKSKLSKLVDAANFFNDLLEKQEVLPNENGDWLSQRNENFTSYIPLGDKSNKNNKNTFFVPMYSNGVKTNRDSWVYNYDVNKVIGNTKQMIDFYNQESVRYGSAIQDNPYLEVESFINADPTKISWSRALRDDIKKGKRYTYDSTKIYTAVYRPFTKMVLYFDKQIINDRARIPSQFPTQKVNNYTICITGLGGKKGFSAFITSAIPDLNILDAGAQCFPLYYYEKAGGAQAGLFDSSDDYVRKDGVSDFIFKQAHDKYVDNRIEKEDIFYYVYGLLHSPDYRREFANDLKKMLPRLPLVDKLEDFWAFSEAGRKLAKLHVDYEEVESYAGVKVSGTQNNNYHVTKMKFIKKGDKSTILYNESIKIENIPEKAYEYVVNGKSAIEWILDRYQMKTDKASGIVNDPNDWAKEVGNPRYILDLLLSVINVSVQTVDIVNSLPKLTFETERSE